MADLSAAFRNHLQQTVDLDIRWIGSFPPTAASTAKDKTELRLGDCVGYGMSEDLGHLQKGSP